MARQNGEPEVAAGSRLWLLLNPPKTMGDRIRFLRIAQGLTQTEIAEQAGRTGSSSDLTKSFISLLEADRTQPSVKTLYGLAQALGVSMDWLFTGQPPRRRIPHIKVKMRTETPKPITRKPRVFIEVVRERDGKTERVTKELSREVAARLTGGAR